MCFLFNFVFFSSLWNWKFTQLWIIESHLSKCLLRWGKSLLPLFLLQPLLLQFWLIKHKEPHERQLCSLLEVSGWIGDLRNTRNVLPKWPLIEQAESCDKLLKMIELHQRRQIKNVALQRIADDWIWNRILVQSVMAIGRNVTWKKSTDCGL